jgi:5-formyltetrahydrofolate cyclo-ligase
MAGMPKKAMRREIRALLGDVTEGERNEKSIEICRTLTALDAWRDAHTVCLFAPQHFEPDIDGMWSQATGRRFCYPKIFDDELEAIEVEQPAGLVIGKWNLRMPALDEPKVMPHRIDLVLVPGVAFSSRGERLGRGGGFYDRFLAMPGLRAKKVGVCFDLQIREELPTEAHDRAVDLVVTESRVLVASAAQP